MKPNIDLRKFLILVTLILSYLEIKSSKQTNRIQTNIPDQSIFSIYGEEHTKLCKQVFTKNNFNLTIQNDNEAISFLEFCFYQKNKSKQLDDIISDIDDWKIWKIVRQNNQQLNQKIRENFQPSIYQKFIFKVKIIIKFFSPNEQLQKFTKFVILKCPKDNCQAAIKKIQKWQQTNIYTFMDIRIVMINSQNTFSDQSIKLPKFLRQEFGKMIQNYVEVEPSRLNITKNVIISYLTQIGTHQILNFFKTKKLLNISSIQVQHDKYLIQPSMANMVIFQSKIQKDHQLMRKIPCKQYCYIFVNLQQQMKWVLTHLGQFSMEAVEERLNYVFNSSQLHQTHLSFSKMQIDKLNKYNSLKAQKIQQKNVQQAKMIILNKNLKDKNYNLEQQYLKKQGMVVLFSDLYQFQKNKTRSIEDFNSKEVNRLKDQNKKVVNDNEQLSNLYHSQKDKYEDCSKKLRKKEQIQVEKKKEQRKKQKKIKQQSKKLKR